MFQCVGIVLAGGQNLPAEHGDARVQTGAPVAALPVVPPAVSWAIKVRAVVARLVSLLGVGVRCRVVAPRVPTAEQIAALRFGRVETHAAILWRWWRRRRCCVAHHQRTNLVRLFILVILRVVLQQPLRVSFAVSPRVRRLLNSQLCRWLLRLCSRCRFEAGERWQAAAIRLIS